jgi:hypothetical protein
MLGNLRRPPTQKDKDEAAIRTIMTFPQLVDYYIKMKEASGDEARDISSEKVIETIQVFETQVKELQWNLAEHTSFYKIGKTTYDEAHQRLAYLKDVIENKGGHKIFYHDGKAVQRESDLQIVFRFVWFGSPSDVGTEANDGRGPVDYKVARGAKDKTLIEMKLAKNTGLERNLRKAASDLPSCQRRQTRHQGHHLFFGGREGSCGKYFEEAETDRAQGCRSH